MHKDTERVLYSKEELSEAVKRLGQRITDDHKGRSPVFVGILKGATIFMADLMRAIDLDCEIDFMVARSYGSGAVSSGNVEILKDITVDIKGRDVIIVEDILDTGLTLSVIKKHLMEREPTSIKICALLDKTEARVYSDVKADYKCFDIANEFVVGYGLDYAEKYRNLDYIGVLKKEIYLK